MNFLCIIVDKTDNSTIAEYQVNARELYFALHKARSKFEHDQKYIPKLRKHTNWYVDGVELD